jgi:hypothetical protein
MIKCICHLDVDISLRNLEDLLAVTRPELETRDFNCSVTWFKCTLNSRAVSETTRAGCKYSEAEKKRGTTSISQVIPV